MHSTIEISFQCFVPKIEKNNASIGFSGFLSSLHKIENNFNFEFLVIYIVFKKLEKQNV